MNILLVDDHPLFLDGLKQALGAFQADVAIEQSVSAEAALSLLDAGMRFELLLVDLGLPGMDGAALISTLANRQLWIPSAIISASDDTVRIAETLRAGALGFIPKSHSAAEILHAIRLILAGNVYVPTEIKQRLEQLSMSEVHPIDAAKFGVTPRQLSVLSYIGQGYSNKGIAQALNLSEHTVKSHVKALLSQLNVKNRTACVRRAEQLGLLRNPHYPEEIELPPEVARD